MLSQRAFDSKSSMNVRRPRRSSTSKEWQEFDIDFSPFPLLSLRIRRGHWFGDEEYADGIKREKYANKVIGWCIVFGEMKYTGCWYIVWYNISLYWVWNDRANAYILQDNSGGHMSPLVLFCLKNKQKKLMFH